LFKGTVLFNITLETDSKNVDFKKLSSVISSLEMGGFIKSLGDGYNTEIGDRGAFLSGGQRQRIVLARLLYAERKVIFLDEGTNSLDQETEILAMRPLLNFGDECTVFVISHTGALKDEFDVVLSMSASGVKLERQPRITS
jgi:ABC-type bacteriocin/lantibiotic exporter with double-glycine peptidase domain